VCQRVVGGLHELRQEANHEARPLRQEVVARAQVNAVQPARAPRPRSGRPDGGVVHVAAGVRHERFGGVAALRDAKRHAQASNTNGSSQVL
jgi:hypothetical protein